MRKTPKEVLIFGIITLVSLVFAAIYYSVENNLNILDNYGGISMPQITAVLIMIFLLIGIFYFYHKD